jgi:hypothetical protein
MPFQYQKILITFRISFHYLCHTALNNLNDLKISNFSGDFKSDLLVKFEILTLATMKNTISWDVTTCNLVDIYVSDERTASIFSVKD